MNCFDCIFISMDNLALFDANLFTAFMISLFLAAPARRV